jgi:hypothetical protein
MEQTECSETSAYKIQTPGNYPEENIQQRLSSLRLCRLLSLPCQYGLVVSFTGVQQPAEEADLSLPFDIEVKNECSCVCTPQYGLMALCLIKFSENFFWTDLLTEDL